LDLATKFLVIFNSIESKNMQKLFLYLCLVIILTIVIFFLATNIVDHFRLDKPYKAKVVKIEYGNNIILSNNKVVGLAGVFIPYQGTNYRPELLENINNLLLGKIITVREVLKYKGEGDGYPLFPLVEAYLEDGTMINAKLLKEGMAFFDFGYYRGKKKFKDLQEEARINKKGIWGRENPPLVVYVGSRKGLLLHYPECPKVKEIKEGDKVFYYFHPPDVYWGKGFDGHCEYREAIEKARGIDSKTQDYMQP